LREKLAFWKENKSAVIDMKSRAANWNKELLKHAFSVIEQRVDNAVSAQM
jgi:hypothetical protein